MLNVRFNLYICVKITFNNMGFEKGKPRPANAGRKEGSVNKLTKTVKEKVLEVFNELQDDPKSNLL